jgi:hypothetical protein
MYIRSSAVLYLKLLKIRNARIYVVNLIIKFYKGAGSFKSERVGRLLSPNPKSWHFVGLDHWLAYLPCLGMINKLANE